jgi:cytosine/creatinine deaminase
MAIDGLPTHRRLADGRLVDIGSAGGRITTIARTPRRRCRTARRSFDIGADLMPPGLFDGHMHLDKTLMRLPWKPHAAGPTRMSRT